MPIETEDTVRPGRSKRFFLLGPPALLIHFAYAVSAATFTDLVVYHTCLVTATINATECLMLRNNASSPEAVNLEIKVEPYAGVILMSHVMIKSILPVVFSLFLGPWSDRGGRKPLLLAATGGMTLTFAILALMCNWNINPWYLLLSSIPENTIGGIYTAKVALVCLISDSTVDNKKTVQMALLEVSFHSGTVLGAILGVFIYRNYGYVYIFAIAAICCMSAFTYTHFIIPETVKDSSRESIRGLFKISSIKELVASCVVKRKGFNRLVVWLSICVITWNGMIHNGDMTVDFLFTRARLGWDVQQFSFFHVAEVMLRITGLCGVSLRSRFLGVSDMLLAGISLVSSLGGAIAKSFAWKSWHMYLSAGIKIFSGITVPVLRSIISKSVPVQDAGKVFSLTVILEVIGGFGGPIIFTLIYSNYLPPIYPSPVYLFSVVIFIASLACLLCMEISIRNHQKPPTYIPAAQEDDLPS